MYSAQNAADTSTKATPSRLSGRPAARVRVLPGHPRRKLTTGVRAGADRDPAVRAFRAALGAAIRATTGGLASPGAATDS